MSVKRTITLCEPVVLTIRNPSGEERQETITHLEFPVGVRLRAKHLRVADGHEGDMAKTIALIAYFTDQPIKVIDELVEADLSACNEVLEDFRYGRSTGPKP